MSRRYDPSEPALRLFSVAEGQGGYFTTAQALSSGYSYRAQHFHVERGNWLRIGPSVFRLRAFPVGEREDLIRWSFWSLGRGIVSHDSALEFHGLGDVVPDRVHLTVPPGFRKRAAEVTLHRAVIPEADIETHHGFRVTTPVRTLLDAASSELDPDRFNDAVRQALLSARVRRKRLEARASELAHRARRRLEAAFAAGGQP